MEISELVEQVHKNAVEKGFWDKPREIGTRIALIHSEVTEALDAETCLNFCEELADICIRIFDVCGGLEVDLEKSLSAIIRDDEVMKEIQIDISSITALEESLAVIAPNFNHEKQACDVNRYLSYALEGDRKNDKKKFNGSIAMAFLCTIIWASCAGYVIEQDILNKMERNKQRPRMHGKKY